MANIQVSDAERSVVRTAYDTAAGTVRVAGVKSITRASTTATVTHAKHGHINGQNVTFAGADQSAYNVTAAITVVDADTYTYTVSGSPATPATCVTAGAITATNTEQSVWMNAPHILYVESIGATTTVKVEACMRLAHGWVQVGSDLTSTNNTQFVILPARYNFVRLRRSSGSNAIKIHAQS